MKSSLHGLIVACNDFYRLAIKKQYGLVYDSFPISLVLEELHAKKQVVDFDIYYTIKDQNGGIIDIATNINGAETDVEYPAIGGGDFLTYPSLKKAIEAVLEYMNISPEDLRERFEKPDFMGEQFMPEDYI